MMAASEGILEATEDCQAKRGMLGEGGGHFEESGTQGLGGGRHGTFQNKCSGSFNGRSIN